MKHSFFYECKLPTATAQQRRHWKGKTWMPESVKLAQAFWLAVMKRHAPEKPLKGAVSVICVMTWTKTGKKEENAVTPKTTRPDVDNLAKLILDAGTSAGWWKDDNQIFSMTIEKYHGPIRGIAITAQENAQ